MAALKPPLKKNLKLEPFQNIDLIRYTLSETFGPGTETPEQFWAEIEIMEVFQKNTLTRYSLAETMGPVSRPPNILEQKRQDWWNPGGALENRTAAETTVSYRISSE